MRLNKLIGLNYFLGCSESTGCVVQRVSTIFFLQIISQAVFFVASDYNIQVDLEKENKKQVDLAEGIGVSKQTMSKIMNGARAINAIELHKISEYLHVSMDSLMKLPEKPMDTNVMHAC